MEHRSKITRATSPLFCNHPTWNNTASNIDATCLIYWCKWSTSKLWSRPNCNTYKNAIIQVR